MTISVAGTQPAAHVGEITDLEKPQKRRARLKAGWLAPILFAIPVLVIFGYFAWGPIVSGVVLSLQSNNFVTDAEWVGFDNFAFVLKDPLLGQALLNTAYFALLALVLGFPIPILLAIFITEVRRRRGIYTVLAYLPVIMPPVAGILLWKVFYYPDGSGLFNSALSVFGIGPIGWLQDPALAMPSIVIYAIWSTAGGTAIIFVAALSGVRADLYEAAELDGAGIWSRMWNVTFPQIRGVILIILLIQIISTLQLFAEPYLFTGGGPINSTVTLMLLVYRYAFIGGGDFGAATALSVLLALMLGLFSMVYLMVTRRWSAN